MKDNGLRGIMNVEEKIYILYYYHTEVSHESRLIRTRNCNKAIAAFTYSSY
jgi:hypothetical protein